VKDMGEILRLASMVIVADQPFYKNVYVIVPAALVVAVIILVVALLLFRSSGKKKRAGAAGSSDWQRQAQQGTPGGWNQQGMGMPAAGQWGQQGQQPNMWGAQQAGGWDAQSPAQQPGGWGAQSPAQQQAGGWGAQSPAPQQPVGWDAQNFAQQQAGGWGAQSPAQQQAGGWGNQGAGSAGGQQSLDAPASKDAWAQQQGASPWGAQSNQPAPTAYGGSGSGQSWPQSAQVADQWGQPGQQPAQPAQQGGWPANYQQPSSSTPPGGNAPWQQPGQGFGQGQQGFAASPFESADGDRTMLRSTGGPQGIGIVRIEEGKEPGRVYEVRKETLSIGRSRESDIFLEDLAVSRLHASIINLGNNNYALRDEGSANGTKVNGQMVNKYQPYPLQEGDKIQLGQTVLVFGKR
jgi:FHA domain